MTSRKLPGLSHDPAQGRRRQDVLDVKLTHLEYTNPLQCFNHQLTSEEDAAALLGEYLTHEPAATTDTIHTHTHTHTHKHVQKSTSTHSEK